MKKKHIVTIGYNHFALDSITSANSLVAALSKAQRVDYEYADHGRIYKPLEEDARSCEVELKLNQKFRPPAPPKPEPKVLALPKPKRGTILCICEKSHVAPRQSCPQCGRPFSESHNRTHANNSGPTLRLL